VGAHLVTGTFAVLQYDVVLGRKGVSRRHHDGFRDAAMWRTMCLARQKSISLRGPPAAAARPDSFCSVTETVAVQSWTARSATCTAASSSAAATGSDKSMSGRASRNCPAA